MHLLALLLTASGAFAESTTPATYAEAFRVGHQIVPLYANGHLIYLERPSKLRVFRPDTTLAYRRDIPCPPPNTACSFTSVAVTRQGIVALGMAQPNGIQLLDPTGSPSHFFPTGAHIPQQLTFDANGDLWTLGWERDAQNPYPILRKYSPDGKSKGEFLSTSLWPANQRPHLGGRGYWTMYAAQNRVGAVLNENHGGRTPEWVEWDLDGNLLHRTQIQQPAGYGRAYTGRGHLYAQFPIDPDTTKTELRRLDPATNTWLPIPNVQPATPSFLLGADGDHLIFQLGQPGNVQLVRSRPD